MNFDKFPITHRGQEVAICNRIIGLFMTEEDDLGSSVRSLAADLDAVLPEEYRGKRVVWLKTFWSRLNIPEKKTVTPLLDLAYNEYKVFATKQRNEYKPSIRRLIRDREVAVIECGNDDLHTPTYDDYVKNGLPSKGLGADPSTNINYLIRLEKIGNLTAEQKQEVHQERCNLKPQMFEDTFWDDKINLDDYRLTEDNPPPPDPPEDFPSFSDQVDGGSDLTIISNRITFTTMARNVDTWVADDKGAGHFTSSNVDHLLTVNTSTGSAGGVVVHWGLTNVAGEMVGIIADAGEDALLCYMVRHSPTTASRWLRQVDGTGTTQDGTATNAVGTKYHNPVISGSTIEDWIYNDVNRTSLYDMLTLSITITVAFQFVSGITSSNSGSAANMTGFIEDLDLQAVAAGGVGPLINSGLVNNSLIKGRLIQ